MCRCMYMPVAVCMNVFVDVWVHTFKIVIQSYVWAANSLNKGHEVSSSNNYWFLLKYPVGHETVSNLSPFFLKVKN